MIKVGDFVRYINGKIKTIAIVEIVGQIPNYVGVSTGENVYIEDCELWQPEEGEWCWIDGVFAKYIRSTFCITSDGIEFTSFGGFETLEPFIGTLPRFIKDI